MADLFLADESSEQDSAPIELYDITISTTTYYLTSAIREIAANGRVYTPYTLGRGAIGVAQLNSGAEPSLSIRMRVDHALVRRWYAQGVPPKSASVIAYRMQQRSGLIEQFWRGPIATIHVEAFGGNPAVATLTVASLLGAPFRRRLPTITAGRDCTVPLYGAGCSLSRTGSNADGIPFKCSATVLYVNGRDVRLDLSTVPAAYSMRADWLVFGELVHLPTGERMTIAAQNDSNPGISTVTTVTMQMQIYRMAMGNAIEVYAGCAHDVGTCQQKFANQVNYRGMPALPTKNPFFPTGLGVMEQA